jgi:hypothetical protein
MSVSTRKRYPALISIEEKSGLLAGYRQRQPPDFPRRRDRKRVGTNGMLCAAGALPVAEKDKK